MLTDSERAIMEVFWASEEPLTQMDAVTRVGEKDWKDKTVFVIIKRLMKKGLLETVGMVRRANVYARTFAPTCTREEYWASEARQSTDDVPGLVSALLKRSDVPERTIQELEALIEQKKREIEKT